MAPTSNKAIIFKKAPEGFPKPGEDLVVEDRPIELVAPEGGVVAKVLYSSFDPYQRGRLRNPEVKSYFPALTIGQPIENSSLLRVVESKTERFAKGDVVKHLMCPNQQYVVLSAEQAKQQNVFKVEESGEFELAHHLGALGMPGLTAYSSLFEIGKPKKGETIFVSSAAGAVGQLVGQLAKREGLTVIGSVGSDEKVEYCKELGFDHAFNYKKESPDAALTRLAPGGIDIYYENVGGEHLEAALKHMNKFGRIPTCGMISEYNVKPEDQKGIKGLMNIVSKEITMRGFLVNSLAGAWAAKFTEDVTKGLKDGSIKAKLHVVDGIDNGPEGFVGMLRGENFGKASECHITIHTAPRTGHRMDEEDRGYKVQNRDRRTASGLGFAKQLARQAAARSIGSALAGNALGPSADAAQPIAAAATAAATAAAAVHTLPPSPPCKPIKRRHGARASSPCSQAADKLYLSPFGPSEVKMEGGADRTMLIRDDLSDSNSSAQTAMHPPCHKSAMAMPGPAAVDLSSVPDSALFVIDTVGGSLEPVLDPSQAALVDRIVRGENIFFTGSAGSGKSTVLKAFVKRLRAMGKRVDVVAPTGRAALEVEGSTVHSYAGWDASALSLGEATRRAKKPGVKKRLRATQVLVIDEISMVSSFTFDLLSHVMQAARYGDQRPFGGAQVVVSGDFFQLPPVKPFENCYFCGRELQVDGHSGNLRLCPGTRFETKRKVCQEPRFFDERDMWAFCSSAWRQCNFGCVELQTIHRQRDHMLIGILQKCRTGNHLDQGEIDLICAPRPQITDATLLLPKRDDVLRENETRYNNLAKDSERQYQSVDSVYECPDYLYKSFSSRLEHHKYLDLLKMRKGMVVILRSNISPNKGLVNGSQGIVIGFANVDPNRLPRTANKNDNGSPISAQGQPILYSTYARLQASEVRKFVAQADKKHWPVVKFHNGLTRLIMAECSVNKYYIPEQAGPVLVCRTQIPLMAGWAMTVHRSQGMTMDRVVVDLTKAFERGQAYVALSRTRTLQGLQLKGNTGALSRPFSADPQVRDFYQRHFGYVTRGLVKADEDDDGIEKTYGSKGALTTENASASQQSFGMPRAPVKSDGTPDEFPIITQHPPITSNPLPTNNQSHSSQVDFGQQVIIAKMRFSNFLIGLAPLAAASPLVARQNNQAAAQVALIGGAVESIGVRSNGNLLVSRLDNGQIFSVDMSNRRPSLLVPSLGPNINQAGSMVEIGNDVWYVVGGRANVPGSYGIYKIDLANTTAGQSVPASTVATIQGSRMLNGLTKGWNDDTLLVGDTLAGMVYRVTISSGEVSAVISNDQALAPGQTVAFGIDGMKYVNNTLFFTNIGKQTFNKISIDDQGKPGSVVQIFSGTPGDDFVFNDAGDAFMATNFQNSVIKVTPEGNITRLATVQGSTCTAFGRTDSTKNMLFVGSGAQVVSLTI
ncbi:hypothetical protein PpBr36_00610 [Pyricularia pennisetigena]|uniref:hypothetical protein n=1 Tax=Pyricularia pennisetigena TaxID=1578925 RepID=UPI00115334C4|nr:hypothetical protein PpBr36_00610 [Pyricularia pennisetigena]TLS28628.1 hypothetical protein PpBr36_00610 [Pyricularia pennisetigena]